ncbi:MAG: nickel-dependent lactate racemase [Candidatus Caldatribacteriaceae bacterium]
MYSIKPKDSPEVANVEEMIRGSLREPIAAPPLAEQVKRGMKIVIVGDDLTRPTPRAVIFPILLDELNRCGVPDRDITILIGLGTHRYMREEEIRQSFGEAVIARVLVLNHEWKDSGNFAKLGYTPQGTPIEVNRIAVEADFLIAVGNIVPHCYAGYGGGGKAIQPGICSWDTTGKTHIMPMEQDLYLRIAGEVENAVRQEIEVVAEATGLRFIVNTVLNDEGEIVKVVSGHPVWAHREGVKVAQSIYEREIPALADIVVVSAFPAEIDYWQGIKPLSYAQKGLKKRGFRSLLRPSEEISRLLMLPSFRSMLLFPIMS